MGVPHPRAVRASWWPRRGAVAAARASRAGGPDLPGEQRVHRQGQSGERRNYAGSTRAALAGRHRPVRLLGNRASRRDRHRRRASTRCRGPRRHTGCLGDPGAWRRVARPRRPHAGQPDPQALADLAAFEAGYDVDGAGPDSNPYALALRSDRLFVVVVRQSLVMQCALCSTSSEGRSCQCSLPHCCAVTECQSLLQQLFDKAIRLKFTRYRLLYSIGGSCKNPQHDIATSNSQPLSG